MTCWTHDIDGPIAVPTALDAEGTPAARRSEYHLNVPLSLYDARPELEPYRVEPEQPVRQYAGACGRAVTVCLRFADEAEALGLLGDCVAGDA